MTWPYHYDPIRCGCRQHCGDVPESDDDPDAVCKGLDRAPQPPLVEIVLVSRASPSSDLPKETA